MTAPDRTTCEDVFRRLDDFVDRELSPEQMARIRAHLEICAQCASEYRFEESLLRQVRQKLRRIDVPADLRKKITTILARESGMPPKV
jgi:anti-sigma factor (TIGR02949 family)